MTNRTVEEAADRNEPKWDCPTCGVTHVGARAQAALSSTPRPASEPPAENGIMPLAWEVVNAYRGVTDSGGDGRLNKALDALHEAMDDEPPAARPEGGA